MGNILDFLLFWRNAASATVSPQATSNVAPKLSINCACFNSKVVDDTDSSNSNDGQEDEFHSID